MSGDQIFYMALIGLFITSLTTSVVSPIVIWLVSKEQRRRDLEDRALALSQAKEAAAEAAKIAYEARQAARTNVTALTDVKSDTTSTLEILETVHADVLIAGDKADGAYKEANSVNLKIQALQDVLTDQLGVPEKKITETTKRVEAEAEAEDAKEEKDKK